MNVSKKYILENFDLDKERSIIKDTYEQSVKSDLTRVTLDQIVNLLTKEQELLKKYLTDEGFTQSDIVRFSVILKEHWDGMDFRAYCDITRPQTDDEVIDSLKKRVFEKRKVAEKLKRDKATYLKLKAQFDPED